MANSITELCELWKLRAAQLEQDANFLTPGKKARAAQLRQCYRELDRVLDDGPVPALDGDENDLYPEKPVTE